VRLAWFRHLVKSEPTLLVHHGAFLDGAMRKQRVTHEEVLSVLRREGITAVEDVTAVVMETDGSFSVISDVPSGEGGNVLVNVAGAEERDSPTSGTPRSSQRGA
jgi:uncharacterized membrane protein YcaP (DUF421 family)